MEPPLFWCLVQLELTPQPKEQVQTHQPPQPKEQTPVQIPIQSKYKHPIQTVISFPPLPSYDKHRVYASWCEYTAFTSAQLDYITSCVEMTQQIPNTETRAKTYIFQCASDELKETIKRHVTSLLSTYITQKIVYCELIVTAIPEVYLQPEETGLKEPVDIGIDFIYPVDDIKPQDTFTESTIFPSRVQFPNHSIRPDFVSHPLRAAFDDILQSFRCTWLNYALKK